MATLRHPTSPGQWARARFRDKLRWFARDIARTAIRQLRGSTRPSTLRVYWTRDRRGEWVLHVPISRH